jgi:hypothetical protein
MSFRPPSRCEKRTTILQIAIRLRPPTRRRWPREWHLDIRRNGQIACFSEDVRRQCRRLINVIYRRTDKSSGPVVYVIGVGDPNFVKIGFTTCFEQRLRSLRTASHVEPVVHLVIPGSRSLERELHVRFKSARHNREWFRLTDEVAPFIASERAKAKVYAGRSASLAQVLEFRHTGSDDWSE